MRYQRKHHMMPSRSASSPARSILICLTAQLVKANAFIWSIIEIQAKNPKKGRALEVHAQTLGVELLAAVAAGYFAGSCMLAPLVFQG